MNAAPLLSYTNPPHLHLIHMSQDHDSRETQTLAPPTDREPEHDTMPPGANDAEAIRVMATQIPPAGPPMLNAEGLVERPTTMQELLYNQLMRVHHEHSRRERDLLDADGKFARLNDERAQRIKAETINELAAVVDKLAGQPVQELSRTVASLAMRINEQDAAGAAQDERIEKVEKLVASMKSELLAVIQRETETFAKKIEALDKLVVELKNNGARTPQAQG